MRRRRQRKAIQEKGAGKGGNWELTLSAHCQTQMGSSLGGLSSPPSSQNRTVQEEVPRAHRTPTRSGALRPGQPGRALEGRVRTWCLGVGLETAALLPCVQPERLALHEWPWPHRSLGRAADLWTQAGREPPGSCEDRLHLTRPRRQGGAGGGWKTGCRHWTKAGWSLLFQRVYGAPGLLQSLGIVE